MIKDAFWKYIKEVSPLAPKEHDDLRNVLFHSVQSIIQASFLIGTLRFISHYHPQIMERAHVCMIVRGGELYNNVFLVLVCGTPADIHLIRAQVQNLFLHVLIPPLSYFQISHLLRLLNSCEILMSYVQCFSVYVSLALDMDHLGSRLRIPLLHWSTY